MREVVKTSSISDPREELNERLHRFSHDLKNKLGSLWQALKLLKDLPEGPERDELLVFAERSYFDGAQAVEKLMDDLEVPRGIFKLHKEELELSTLLQRCVEGVAFRTEKKQQMVEMAADPPIHMIGDRELLRNTFEALLSNASKFSPVGSTIRLGMVRTEDKVRIEVKDHGVGLTREDLGKLFTRYAMLSSRSTSGESQARGTLARVRQWVKAHDGGIDASSQGPGKGTVFTVTLPLR